jgi:serine aminopeptidase S33 family
MSSKIYFKQNGKRNFSWWLARAMSNTLLSLPNKTQLMLSKKLLLKPVRRKLSPLPEGINSEQFSFKDGILAIYRIGTGPKVLLSHGWSGAASQLFPLMQRIAAAGYEAVAYDQIGHGQSSGQQGNLFLFIRAKQAMIEKLEAEGEVKAVISHSMGGVAALTALKKPYPLLLIAPVFKLQQSMFEKVAESGIKTRLLENILFDLERQYDMEFFNNNPEKNAADYTGKIHIVHDRNDPFTPLSDSQTVSDQNQHVALKATNNLGHGRIIGSDDTWNAFQQLTESM